MKFKNNKVYKFPIFNWASRAFNDFPKNLPTTKKYDFAKEIAIVGAGASGLAAANILENNNLNYQIFEASNRYGGRLKKSEFADIPVDLGAEWVHNLPEILPKLVSNSDTGKKYELIPYHLTNTFRWNGKKLKKVSNFENNLRFNFMPEYKFKNSSWYDFIDDNFAQKVKKNISFNKEVKTINYQGNNVNLSFSDGASVDVDKVLITSSIGVLKSSNIEFIPELSTKFYDAINSINFKYGFKLIIKFSSKFFPDAVEFKVKNGEKVIYDLGLNKPTTENILGVLIRGEEALEYTNKEPKDIVQQILEELDVVFDGKASSSYLNEFEYENWGDHQFTLGTWVESFRTKPEYLKILNESLSEKVYFAGEAVDTSRMLGVPGAILSGYSSVDKLLSD